MERSLELEELTRKLYEAVSQANKEFFKQYLSGDESCVVIGTAPDEWWDNRDAALQAICAQMETAGNAVLLTEGNLRAYRQGDVGWVADRPTLKVGGVEVRCRHTSVFVREQQWWRIVQHHFSIGVTNEEVFGAEATKLG